MMPTTTVQKDQPLTWFALRGAPAIEDQDDPGQGEHAAEHHAADEVAPE